MSLTTSICLSEFKNEHLTKLGLEDLVTAGPIVIPEWMDGGEPPQDVLKQIFAMLEDTPVQSVATTSGKTLEECFDLWWTEDMKAKRKEIRNLSSTFASQESEMTARTHVDAVLLVVDNWFKHCGMISATFVETFLAMNSKKCPPVKVTGRRPATDSQREVRPRTRVDEVSYTITGKLDYLPVVQAGDLQAAAEVLANRAGGTDVHKYFRKTLKCATHIENFIKNDKLHPASFNFVVIEAKSTEVDTIQELIEEHFAQMLGESLCCMAKLRLAVRRSEKVIVESSSAVTWVLSTAKFWVLGTTVVTTGATHDAGQDLTVMRLPAIELPDQAEMGDDVTDSALRGLVLLLICRLAAGPESIVEDAFINPEGRAVRTKNIQLSVVE